MHAERKITVRSHKHSFTPYPSLSPYRRIDWWTEKWIHLLRVGWRNIFPVVLLCQFFCCGGNSFRWYLPTIPVLPLCLFLLRQEKHSFSLYPSLSPYWQTESRTEGWIHSLHVGWRNIFPVVLLCQFFCCGGNSFRWYLPTIPVVPLCLFFVAAGKWLFYSIFLS